MSKKLSYDDVIAKYEPVLGLEVHVELGTESKMFCGCNTVFGAQPNTQTCPVCLGLPGSLPVVNAKAIEYTIMIGLALNCSIAPYSRFARKNYFYPDMPKNFQTSQYDEPICTNGYLDVTIDTEDGPKEFRIEIERVHMEEDTGKSLHMGGATGRIHGADYSLLDYNRAGIPLVEIVTKIIPGTGKYAPEVARAYVAELRDILRSLGVSDVKMEQGSLRCDANVSLRAIGATTLGTRSETKNVNSLRSVERAVRGEMVRHAEILDGGGKVKQETRHFQEDTGLTRSGRSKEQAEDYRYFPEPDLVPVVPNAQWIEEIRAALPERVRPVSSWKCRVSCFTFPPSSRISAWRTISPRTARSTERSEFTFFVSLRVPKVVAPIARSETLASQRSEPCSIFTSETPSERRMSRSSAT